MKFIDYKSLYPKLRFLATTGGIRNVASDNHIVDFISGCKWNNTTTTFTLNADGSFDVPGTTANALTYVSGTPSTVTGPIVFCVASLSSHTIANNARPFDVGQALVSGPGISIGRDDATSGYITKDASNFLTIPNLLPAITVAPATAALALAYWVNTVTLEGKVVRACFDNVSAALDSGVQSTTATKTGSSAILPMALSTLIDLPTSAAQGIYTNCGWAAIGDLTSAPSDAALLALVRACVANGAKSAVQLPSELLAIVG